MADVGARLGPAFAIPMDMKSWLIAPLFFLQPLAEPPADAPPSCFDLPADQRAACQAREMSPPPPIPPGKETAPPADD